MAAYLVKFESAFFKLKLMIFNQYEYTAVMQKFH